MKMQNFSSPSLKRSFESIVFVGMINVTTAVNADTHAQAGDPPGIERSAIAVAPEPGEITPLDGGKTIGEILAEPTQLSEQQVSLRARVMKISMDILGKNWITLQDGTGTAPENKLIATSADVAAIGDLVTVNGVIRNDVDLGSGYTYKVLLEEATFTK
jgi:hypothetical protein